MEQGLWVLVEWVDDDSQDTKEISSYSVVNVGLIDSNEISEGKTVLVREGVKGKPRRGLVHKISEVKIYLEEMLSLFLGRDKKLQQLVPLCADTNKIEKPTEMILPLITERDFMREEVMEDSDRENSSIEDLIDSSGNDSNPEASPQNDQPAFQETNDNNSSNTPTNPEETPQTEQSQASQEGIRSDSSNTEANVEVASPNVQSCQISQEINRNDNNNIETTTEALPNDQNGLESQEENRIANNTEADNEVTSQNHENRNLSLERIDELSMSNNNTEINQAQILIGRGNVMIPAPLLDEIDWTLYSNATRMLLQAVFPGRFITTNCVDEIKLYRNRQIFKRLRQHNQEIDPPSPASSNEDSNTISELY
ncbi:uncharacterized protein DDB_G0287625-like [Pieris rapae]|uniref:uncharacterized protein DDB_G0287625-like n=1 Tax=Pieris rapae TaxID=64459 RepID=UPI001E27B0B6|nr:uncharacterized protein DDB_G0287625-like [Pieris rapae]